MEDFINDEIDMVLDQMNDDIEEGGAEIELTEWQRGQIFENLRDKYEYIWEDLYNAISGEIQNIIEE